MSCDMTDKTRHRPTSAESRAHTRRALLVEGARGLSRYGYRGVALDRVARAAGCSLATAHQLFENKEQLVLAVVQSVEDSWHHEVGYLFDQESDPVETLVAVARSAAVHCRQDACFVLTNLKVEFAGSDHPVGRAVTATVNRMFEDIIQLIRAGRRSGAIPPGPPPRPLAHAYLGALGGVVSQLDGHAPYDTLLAEKAALGVLGLTLPLSMTGTA
jgi:AcrR family transcriptional regulator